MRVVQDPSVAGAAGRRRADATTIEGKAQTVAVAAGGSAAAGAQGAAGKSLPLLPAGLFLIACAAGGVLVAVVRPLGLG
jgi:hypothetical protein